MYLEDEFSKRERVTEDFYRIFARFNKTFQFSAKPLQNLIKFFQNFSLRINNLAVLSDC